MVFLFKDWNWAEHQTIECGRHVAIVSVHCRDNVCTLTHWSRDKMAACRKRHFQMQFLISAMKMFNFLSRLHWSLFRMVNNIPALVQITAWRPPGDKPLSEPTMFNESMFTGNSHGSWDSTGFMVQNGNVFNSFAAYRLDSNFKSAISEQMLQMKFMNNSRQNACWLKNSEHICCLHNRRNGDNFSRPMCSKWRCYFIRAVALI